MPCLCATVTLIDLLVGKRVELAVLPTYRYEIIAGLVHEAYK